MTEKEARELLADEYRKAGREFRAALVMAGQTDEIAVAAILRAANSNPT